MDTKMVPARSRRRMWSALASTALAGLLATSVSSASYAQGSNVDVAPVDVTARQRRPAARPQPRPAPVVRAAPTPRPRVAARRPVTARPGPVAVTAPSNAPGGQPAQALAQGGFPNGGVAGGRPGEESPVGPIRGFVATRSATATKTNTPLLETPQSITVIGAQQIQAQNAQTLTQAVQFAPGIYGGTFGADARLDYYTLRGFVASDYGLYLNGLQLLNYGFGYFRTEPFGLERVEVLRGPAAVLFGAGTPGGLINAVSKRPTANPFGYTEVGGGSYGQKYGAFDFGGPSDKDGHWFYRLTGYARNGGYQVDGAPDDSYYIAPALTYKPDGATTFTVLSSFQYDNAAVTSNFLPYSGTVHPNLSGLRIPRSLNVGNANINTFTRQQALVGYEFEHIFNDVFTFRQNLRYSFLESAQNSYLNQLGYLDPARETQLFRYQFADSARVNLFQVDNQVEARFADGFFRHDLLMGLDYKNYRLSDNQKTNFAAGYSVPGLDLLNPIETGPVGRPASYLVNADRFQQLGVYLQDQVKLTDRLTLVVGGRGDFADNRIEDRLTPSNSNGRSDAAGTYRTALIYNFDYGLAPYLSYSTSFQPLIGSDINNRTFLPETGNQIEGGVKFEPVGQGYSVTLAGFDIHRNNVLTPNPIDTRFSVQLGEVRSTGFEASLVASLAEGLNVAAAYTIYGITNDRNTDSSVLGKLPVAIPENFASVFADYTIPYGSFAGLGFGGGVRYVGRSFADTANTLRVPDYVLFDAQVHYNWQNWRVAVNASNIADRRTVASCQSVNSCFYGEARRVLASLSYKW